MQLKLVDKYLIIITIMNLIIPEIKVSSNKLNLCFKQDFHLIAYRSIKLKRLVTNHSKIQRFSSISIK
jgi:hypothetical protein